MRNFIIFCIFSLAVFAKPIVSVSIPPQAKFLKEIAGETLEINILIPQGSDPHTFEFKPSTLALLAQSDLYLTIGLEIEDIWLPKLKDSLPHTLILPITEGIDFLPGSLDSHDHAKHAHAEHDHDRDPHIWLSPKRVLILAQNITQILSKHYPQHKGFYAKNLDHFTQKVKSLNAYISQTLQGLKNRQFIVYHPSWAYYAKDYALEQIPVQIEGKEPKAKELKALIELAQKKQIKVIFVQEGFSQTSAEQIAKACGAHSFITHPLAYEWEDELKSITQELAKWQK